MGILYCCVCCCCFKNMLSKSLEIMAIVYQSCSLVFLLCCLIIIKWSKISIVNLLIFILLFLIILVILLLTIFLRYWRAKGIIKTSKKNKGIVFASICFGLSITCFIINIIEEVLIIYGFSKANYPCANYNYEKYNSNNVYPVYKKNLNRTKANNNIFTRNLKDDIDCSYYDRDYNRNVISDAEIYITILAMSYLEISLIFSVCIYHILRHRIIQGLDGPAPTTTRQNIVLDQYGRQVVVVQPGDVVVMDGQRHVVMPADYQNNNQYNNLQQSQNISNQNPNLPNSQDFSLQEKIH